LHRSFFSTRNRGGKGFSPNLFPFLCGPVAQLHQAPTWLRFFIPDLGHLSGQIDRITAGVNSRLPLDKVDPFRWVRAALQFKKCIEGELAVLPKKSTRIKNDLFANS
jgi:hypothetical protein